MRRKTACAYDFRVRVTTFGNAIGNSIVGQIEETNGEAQAAQINQGLAAQNETDLATVNQLSANSTQAFNDQVGIAFEAQESQNVEVAGAEQDLLSNTEAGFTTPAVTGLGNIPINIAQPSDALSLNVTTGPDGRAVLGNASLNGALSIGATTDANGRASLSLPSQFFQTGPSAAPPFDPIQATSNFLGQALFPNLLNYAQQGGTPTLGGTITGFGEAAGNSVLSLVPPIPNLGGGADITLPLYQIQPDQRLGAALFDVANVGLLAYGGLELAGARSAALTDETALNAFNATNAARAETAQQAVTLNVSTAEDVNAAMTAAGRQPAYLNGTNVITQIVPENTQFQMVVSEGQAQALLRGEPAFGQFATSETVPNQAFARNNLSILEQFKSDVSYTATVETTAPQQLNAGIAGPLGGYTGGAGQVEFLGSRNLRLVGVPSPLPPE